MEIIFKIKSKIIYQIAKLHIKIKKETNKNIYFAHY